MKNRVAALFLFLFIVLPMFMWMGGNWLEIPETHGFWDIVTALIGLGFGTAVPYAIVRLLRTSGKN
jgi:hypothetical protein